MEIPADAAWINPRVSFCMQYAMRAREGQRSAALQANPRRRPLGRGGRVPRASRPCGGMARMAMARQIHDMGVPPVLRHGRDGRGSAPESAPGWRGESPLQVNVTCNRLQLRRGDTGWGAAGGEPLVRTIRNLIRPV